MPLCTYSVSWLQTTVVCQPQLSDFPIVPIVTGDGSIGIGARYCLDGPGIESWPIPLAERFKDRPVAARLQVSLVRICQFQWLSGLRQGFVASHLLGLRVRIPPGAWMFVL